MIASGKDIVDKDETLPTLACLSNVPSKIIVFCDEVSLSRVYQKNELLDIDSFTCSYSPIDSSVIQFKLKTTPSHPMMPKPKPTSPYKMHYR
jgi:hypothetical protein